MPQVSTPDGQVQLGAGATYNGRAYTSKCMCNIMTVNGICNVVDIQPRNCTPIQDNDPVTLMPVMGFISISVPRNDGRFNYFYLPIVG